MQGTDHDRPRRPEVRIGCTNLAGHPHELIVFDDRGQRVVIFPPGAWAALTPPRVGQLRTALAAPINDHGMYAGDV